MDHNPDIRGTPGGTPSPARSRAPSLSGSAADAAAVANINKRTVCDHCRRRRIRCDGSFPCQQCSNASLTCKREHVPRKRGPKRGHGRVINELRAREVIDGFKVSRESSAEYKSYDGGTDESSHSAAPSAAPSVPSTPPPTDVSWTNLSFDPRHAATTASEPRTAFSSDQYQPTSRSFLHLIPRCLDLYYEHIYPIMPLLYMPAARDMVHRRAGSMTPSEKQLVYALCALTALHMSGQGMLRPPPPGAASWEVVGRFFLDACVSARHAYDFFDDRSLGAVISSFWLSTSFFEINQSRKSWLYLREALTLALDMGLHDEDVAYASPLAAADGPAVPEEELLCRRRVFWQLYVTERSFAILRNKTITFKKTPALPTGGHAYEPPEIHHGFLQLISSYVPLDESFVTAWNEGSDPRVSATTYLALQDLLAAPPGFVQRSRPGTPPPGGSAAAAAAEGAAQMVYSPGSGIISPLAATRPIPPPPAPSLSSSSAAPSSDHHHPYQDHHHHQDQHHQQPQEQQQQPQPEPTAIQKADLLITQQWLRLIVWQSSFRQGLLSWAAPHESMHFAFPLAIARRTASVLQALPASAVEVHGMGMFEKIFEIGTWCVSVLGACDAGGGGRAAGAEFEFGGVLSGAGSRLQPTIDPLEFFVRTLSASPNSRARFAERLLMFAGERPAGLRMSLSPGLSTPGGWTTPGGYFAGGSAGGGTWSADVSAAGSVVGEVVGGGEDDADAGGLSSGQVSRSHSDVDLRNGVLLQQHGPGSGGSSSSLAFGGVVKRERGSLDFGTMPPPAWRPASSEQHQPPHHHHHHQQQQQHSRPASGDASGAWSAPATVFGGGGTASLPRGMASFTFGAAVADDSTPPRRGMVEGGGQHMGAGPAAPTAGMVTIGGRVQQHSTGACQGGNADGTGGVWQ